MPEQMGSQPAAQSNVAFQQKQRYQGETVHLQKPALTQLRQRVMSLPPQELQNLLSNPEAFNKLFSEQPEVQALQKEVARLLEDVQAQLTENLQEREQLKDMFDQYDQKFPEYAKLVDENSVLKAQ